MIDQINSAIQVWLDLHGWRIVGILVVWLAAHLIAHHFTQKRIAYFSQLVRVSIIFIFVTMLLSELGLPVIPLFAGAGILGVTLGFGAQSLVKDVLAGLFVVTENQYVKGDRVKLGNVTGIVQDLSLRVTVLRDDDGVVHFIPYGTVTVISNYSKKQH